MPMSQVRRRRTRRSRRSRRRRSSAMSVQVRRMPHIMPDRALVRMPYTTTIAYNLTGSIYQEYTYRGNSIFDPDASGVGGQPLGFDQWNAFYNLYEVSASSIKVELVNTTVSQLRLALRPSNALGNQTDIDFVASLPYSKVKVMSDRAGDTFRLSNRLSTSVIRGQATGLLTNNQSALNTNPQVQWYWHVGLWAPIDANPVYTCVTIWYDVIFMRREMNLPAST